MMKKALAIFIIGLVFIYSSNSEIKYLETLKRSEFGKTVLETIQIELKAAGGDAVDRILVLLKNLKDGIITESKQDETTYTNEKTVDEVTIKKLEGEIADAKKKLDEATGQLEEDNQSLKSDSKKFLSSQKKLLKKQNLLKKITAQRNKEIKEHEIREKKLYASIDALIEGKEIISKLKIEKPQDDKKAGEKQTEEKKEGKKLPEAKKDEEKQTEGKKNADETVLISVDKIKGVFAQVSNRLNQIRFKDSKYSGFVTSLASMFDVDIVADQTNVQNVIDIFNEIIEQTRKDIKTELDIQQELAQTFSERKLALDSRIGFLNADVNALESKLNNLRISIDENNKLITDLNGEISTKNEELTTTQQSLEDKTKNYNERVKQRQEEIALIEEVEKLFKTKFNAEVREYIKNVKF